MPHFVFRNIPKEQVKEWSTSLLPKIAKELAVPEHRVTFSYVESHSYFYGEDISGKTAFVEIHWVPRPTDKKIAISKLVAGTIKDAGWENPILLYHDFGPETCWFQDDFLTKAPVIE